MLYIGLAHVKVAQHPRRGTRCRDIPGYCRSDTTVSLPVFMQNSRSQALYIGMWSI